ncbi:replication-associated recombination protein A [Metamycoplasma neophronis]|uniref:Replication-associated recombination protein A n=1 Tax=Metamycoplasma neophronis TaxID=872983 RepID=A0ABY2Z1C5_9BACT|nr:replication-associated recombination protein A [Metamycoplasma neophronis]TPR54348.1 replication-associated recombination protein A [Metamycoplasma neophronis]
MNSNLANLVRPDNLESFICDKNKKILFQSVIENDDFRSFIFYGKPGTGKTTISYILAKNLKVSFDYFNAAIDKKEDLVYKLKTNKILIIDEIHRLNKDKQDILLPYLENDLITIYATTTENPYFKLNPALRSRCTIVEIEKPSTETIKNKLIEIAKEKDIDKNLKYNIYEFLAIQANGDFRSAINSLELVSLLSKNHEVSVEEVKKIIPSIQFASDEKADNHYDYLSAFHKSLRGSDCDAALYWGFVIVKSGDFDGLFRRMMCATYEDVGLANPSLGPQVQAAIQTFERLGMPEGYLPIANAILCICLSPKSNSAYLGAQAAMHIIDNKGVYEVPSHLKDAHYSSASKLGRGIGYKYPHDYTNHFISQQYLPDELKGMKLYKNQTLGYEAKINEYWEKLKK